jgi:uncharacterized protein
MTRKQSKNLPAAHKSAAWKSSKQTAKAAALRPAPPTVSGRWVLIAVPSVIVIAALCAWGVLCLLFWQGSWQLLYHPSSKVTRTPANVKIPFSSVNFDPSPSGTPRLSGWWIPAAENAPQSRYTFLYLHGQDGNLSDAVDQLADLHDAGVNVFAFDYRGYGQSEFDHPSEAHWLEDAESALQYLVSTRHVNPTMIVLDGNGLGADLALEMAAAHSELAGVVLESILDDPMNAIWNDGRAHLVPAHLLVHDRYKLDSFAEALRIPSLWFLASPQSTVNGSSQHPAVFEKANSRKMLVWLPSGNAQTKNSSDALSRWLGDLEAH